MPFPSWFLPNYTRVQVLNSLTCAKPTILQWVVLLSYLDLSSSLPHKNASSQISYLSSPPKNRYNSDWRTLQPFPALIALILPRRIYFRNVGLEIFKYWIASLVVKTTSFSIKDISLPPFFLVFTNLAAKYIPNSEAFIHLTRSYWSLLVNFSLNSISKLRNYFILK